MKPLERTVLQMLDWKDQPPTSHVLFPPSGDRTPVAIDHFHLSDGMLHGFVHTKDDVVVVLPADCNWIIYSRDLVNEITTEEAIRQTYARGLAMESLEKELAPEGKKHPAARTMEYRIAAEESESGPAMMSGPDPGQYL